MRTAPITSPARLAVAVAVLVSCLGAAGVARAEAPPRNDVWPRDINIVSSRGDSQIMSVTNTGGANLKDIRWHVDGPSGGRVSEGPGSTCSFESLPHGAACSLTLVWHPSSDRLGTWNPTLRITANGPTVSMPMTLSSVDPPMLSTDPDPVSFGDA